MKYLSLLLLYILAVLLIAYSYDTSRLTKDYPTPNVEGQNRILGMLLTYNYNHIDPLMLIMGEYQSMCEGGWAPTVAIFTTVPFSSEMRRYLRQKTYCYRTNSSVSVIISVHEPGISVALGAEHRKFMGDKVNDYDVFVYHEDDIIFKHSQLNGFLYETRRLHELMPEDGLMNHNIGFQRFRRLLHGENGHANDYGEQDIFEQELLEETPNFNPVCMGDGGTAPYLHVTGNLHQAMWVFTREQINMLQEKCGFLNQSSPSREFMSSFSVWDHCHLNKLLPAERFAQFIVQHYYQQRHVSWYPAFHSDENIRAGYHYYAVPKVNLHMPPCWHAVQEESFREQYGNKTREEASPRRFFY